MPVGFGLRVFSKGAFETTGFEYCEDHEYYEDDLDTFDNNSSVSLFFFGLEIKLLLGE